MLQLWKAKQEWVGPIPHKSLRRKFQQNFNLKNILKSESAKIQKANLDDLYRLAGLKYFGLFTRAHQIYLDRNGTIQKVDAPTSHARILLETMESNNYQKEHMQIVAQTNEGIETSTIVTGKQSSVSGPHGLVQSILELQREATKYGKKLKSIHILHTHPSLEVMINTESRTLLNLHPLSSSDILVQQRVQDHFDFPVMISAITAGGLQYTSLL